jgi:hypothetical protein
MGTEYSYMEGAGYGANEKLPRPRQQHDINRCKYLKSHITFR